MVSQDVLHPGAFDPSMLGCLNHTGAMSGEITGELQAPAHAVHDHVVLTSMVTPGYACQSSCNTPAP
jgi:hypothetical protein